MTDVRPRLRELDRLAAPDLWAQIQTRAAGDEMREVPETPNRPSAGRRVRAALLAAVVFAAAGIFAWHAFRPVREAHPSGPPSAHDVWTTLHRPLALPIAAAGSCPSSPIVHIRPVGGGFSGHGPWPARGQGPLYVVAEPDARVVRLRPSDRNVQGWYGLKTILAVKPSYRGPLLVRTAQLEGTGGIGFGPGDTAPTLTELRLDEPTNGIDWRTWPTVTLVRSPGCFAYQIDGTSFTEVIVFEARAPK